MLMEDSHKQNLISKLYQLPQAWASKMEESRDTRNRRPLMEAVII